MMPKYLIAATILAACPSIAAAFCHQGSNNNVHVLNTAGSCHRRSSAAYSPRHTKPFTEDSGSRRSSALNALPVVSDESYSDILPSSPKGVIFDMDGTLIQHVFDFANMRERVYEIADNDPIGKDLDRGCVLALAGMLSCEGQEECTVFFAECEKNALEKMKVMPGGPEFVKFLRDSGLRRAVLTRNLAKNVPAMSDLYLNEMGEGDDDESTSESLFDPIIGRDTKSNPSDEEPLKSKPYPDGILHICNMWGCDPSEVIMVGDNANDDIMAANRAGCGGSVLLAYGGESQDTHSGYEVGDSEEDIMLTTPSLRVESMLELKSCLEVLLKRSDEKTDQTKLNSEQSRSGSMVFEGEGFSVEIPSIGVKNV